MALAPKSLIEMKEWLLSLGGLKPRAFSGIDDRCRIGYAEFC